MTSGIERRLDGIERRMARVERELGIAVKPVQSEPATPPPPQQATAPALTTPPRPAIAPPPLVIPRAVANPVGATPASPASFLRDERATQASPLRDAPMTIRALNYEAPAPPKPVRVESAWEQLIGLKLAGWIGAIVLVIGAGFGVKYAYDQGFFKGVHPAVWLSLLSLFAFALIGAGEYVYRRISQISATGLFGAGVAMLFIVSYAGHAYYELYQRETAFTLMALSTLIGAAVAMRARLVSIAVLSLIGGTLAPLVLHGDQTLVVPFMSYLLMLQVVALALSWWGAEPKWWTLRAVSLTGTGIWMAWMLAAAPPWGAVTFFVIAYAALYQLEIVLSSLRTRDMAARSAGAAFSVIVTAALTAALLWVLRHEPDAIRGMVVVALSAVTLALSRLLRRVAALSHAYRMQAAVLALVAVPVAFSGAAISFGWAGLAIALALVGAKTDDRGARYTAIAAWALAVVNLAGWYANEHAAASAMWFRAINEPLVAWVIVAWCLAGCGHVIGYLHGLGLRDRDPDKLRALDGSALSIAGSALFAFAAAVGMSPMAASLALIAYAWLLIAVHRVVPKLELAPQAAGVMGFAMAKWLIFDTIWRGLMNDWAGTTAYLPIVNPLTVVGLSLAGTMLVALRLMPEARRQSFRGAASWAAFLITLWTGTMEIDRLVTTGAFIGAGVWPAWQLRQFSWTAWWAAAITAFLAVAYMRDETALRRKGSLRWLAAMIVILGIKYLIMDTLGFRLLNRPAAVAVAANLQTFAGAIVFAALVLVRYMLGEAQGAHVNVTQTSRFASALAMTMLLIVGSLEIDRAFHVSSTVMAAVTDPRLAGQVALSIYWSLFAIGAVALGFRIRLASLRYFGLGLFAVTLLKVGVIDLQSAATGYRILSFMGLGGLLLGTSVLYGKLSPRLLSAPAAA